jgi:hypothetical protein
LVGFAIARITTPVAEDLRAPETVESIPDPPRPLAAREDEPALTGAHARIAQLERELHGKQSTIDSRRCKSD